MKKQLLLLLLLSMPLLGFTLERNFLTDNYYNDNSDIESVFLYGTINTMGGYPMTGVGIRLKKGYAGLDLSGSALPLNGFSPLIYKAKATYLFFPAEVGFYLGVGGGALTEPETIKGTSAFAEGSIGYQWKTKSQSHVFIEGSAIAPFKADKKFGSVWPSISFGFGY